MVDTSTKRTAGSRGAGDGELRHVQTAGSH